MANISAELAAIMAAILGEQVRGSIHDAIGKINDVSEHIFSTGSTDPTGNAIYSDLLYLNETSWDLFKSNSTSPYAWSKIGNLEGNKITSITGPVTDPSTPLVDTYTINFSKIGPVTFNVTNGRGISSITGPISVGLIDTYTINYNDGTSTTFDVNNGKGIDSITGPISAGLVDTYTINYNDGTTQTYAVTNGKDGVTWYRGNIIAGKDVNPTVFPNSGIPYAKENDFYLNYFEGAIYHCYSPGDSTTATWQFDFTISGGGATGVQSIDDLDDVSIDSTSLGPGQVLMLDSTGNWVNSPLPSVDQVYSPSSTAAQSGKAVAQALSSYEQPLVKNAGSKTWNDLITNASTYLTASNTNKFYRLSTAGAVTSSNESLFVSGIVEGEHFSVDSHIAVVEESAGVYKYDYFGGGIEPEVYFESSGNSLSYTFTHDAINENSTINLYSNIVGDKYTNISVSGHTCTVTMAVAQARILTIYVK